MTLNLDGGKLHDQILHAPHGLGEYRYVNCAHEPLIEDVIVAGPKTYLGGDDYSGVCTWTGDGNGYTCRKTIARRLNVAFRCCDNDRQNITLDHCIVDSRLIGINEDWVFGLMGRTAGIVKIIKGQMRGGGSYRNPNKSHRIYIGHATSLDIDGWHSYGNIAGRDIQVYDGENLPPSTPLFWNVRNTVIESHKLPGYSAVQSNRLIESHFENCVISNEYCCIEANGDVHIKDSTLLGAADGYSAGVRAMRDNIRIVLENVDNRCPIPVDFAGHADVDVQVR